jgi:hypothetical protein
MVLVLEVGGELAHEGLGSGCFSDVGDRPDYFFGVSGGADPAFRVVRGEQVGQPSGAFVVEAFMRTGQQTSHPVQRVALAAARAEGPTLHTPTALVELAVLDLDHMERVGYLGCV